MILNSYRAGNHICHYCDCYFAPRGTGAKFAAVAQFPGIVLICLRVWVRSLYRCERPTLTSYQLALRELAASR